MCHALQRSSCDVYTARDVHAIAVRNSCAAGYRNGVAAALVAKLQLSWMAALSSSQVDTVCQVAPRLTEQCLVYIRACWCHKIQSVEHTISHVVKAFVLLILICAQAYTLLAGSG